MSIAQGSLAIQKMVLDSGQVAPGAPGSLYGAVQTFTTATAGGTSLIPAGIWMVMAVTNVSVEFCQNGATGWITYIASGEGGVVISDGYNMRLNNSNVATAILVSLA